MTHGHVPSFARSARTVAWLAPRDRLARDDEQRARHLGLQAAGTDVRTLAATREELAHRIATASRAASESAFDEVETCARRLRRIGLDLGFPTLAAAADNVLDCMTHADGAALGATVARLHRLGVLALQDIGG